MWKDACEQLQGHLLSPRVSRSGNNASTRSYLCCCPGTRDAHGRWREGGPQAYLQGCLQAWSYCTQTPPWQWRLGSWCPTDTHPSPGNHRPPGLPFLGPGHCLTARWPSETGKERKGLPRGRAGQTLCPQDIPSLSSGDQDERDEVLLPPGTPALTHEAWGFFLKRK